MRRRLAETVTTLAEGSFVQTTSSERSALLTSTQIEMVAVRGRDVISLLRVLPGVAYGADSEAPGGSFGTTTPNIGGIRNTWNTVTVDGLVGNDLGSPQIFSGTINFDAIGEVKVQLNNYQAEHGRNGGAMVSIVTKSGGREYRGSGYLYKRHESLNANDFFNNRSGIAKPLYRYTTLGATLGGPVPLESAKDKLFFFYSFENWDTRVPQPVRRVTVPTALERTGDFSQSLNQAGQLIVIRDPTTGQPFTNNRIPSNLDQPERPGPAQRVSAAQRARSQHHRRELQLPVPGKPGGAATPASRADRLPADGEGRPLRPVLDVVRRQSGLRGAGRRRNWGLLGQHYTFDDNSLILNYTRILSPLS